MAQDFSRRLYHSAAWRRNSKNYINAILDTSGHVLVSMTEGGRTFYCRRDDPLHVPVPNSSVVPPGVCERCFMMGELTPATLVHHKVHLTPKNVNDPKVALSYDNFQRLCQDCHAFVHSGQTDMRAEFDESGSIVGPSRADDFRAQMLMLTETTDERRNIHRGGRNE